MNEALAAWNPWWKAKGVPLRLRGHPRHVTAILRNDLRRPEILAVTGIRRCGKTTILYQLIDDLIARGVPAENVLFVNLEDPGLDGVEINELIDAGPPWSGARRYVFLDEVQARDGWERWLRARYDRKEPFKFIVSGSSSDLTGGEFSRLLTGRNLTRVIRPLTLAEFSEFNATLVSESPDIYTRLRPQPPAHLDLPSPPQQVDDHSEYMLSARYLDEGGFPAIAAIPDYEGRDLLQQYFFDILHRDLVHRRGCDAEKIQRLAVYLAETFARPQTKRALARGVNLAPETVASYLDALRSAYLIEAVPRFTESPKPSREDAAPFKVYWADTGLRNAVVREPRRDVGRQAENIVAVTLAAFGRPSYWTDGKGHAEVDFVVPRGDGRLDAYQVCYHGLMVDAPRATAGGAVTAARENFPAVGSGQPVPRRSLRDSALRKPTLDDIPAREWTGFEALAAELPKKRLGDFTLLSSSLQGVHQGALVRPLSAWLLENQLPQLLTA